jgi:hypothetical protein
MENGGRLKNADFVEIYRSILLAVSDRAGPWTGNRFQAQNLVMEHVGKVYGNEAFLCWTVSSPLHFVIRQDYGV